MMETCAKTTAEMAPQQDGAARPWCSAGAVAFLRAWWKSLALAIYAVWIIGVGFHHEPFADEAQAWLIGRDASLARIFGQVLHYEGSPGLWHALMWALNRLHFPYEGLFLVSAAFGVAGAALVLWRAPFPAWMRIGVIASYFYGYQFAIVARSYAIDLVLVPLAACWFGSRTRHPLRYGFVIALIASCNSHGFCAAAVMGLEFAWALWRDKPRNLASAFGGLAVAAAGGLVTIATVWPYPDTQMGIVNASPPVAKVLFILNNALIDRVLLFGGKPDFADHAAGFLLGMIVAIPTFVLMGKSRNGILAFGCLLSIVAFAAFVHVAEWHAGVLWLFWVFGLWICWDDGDPREIRMAACSFAVIAMVQFVQVIQTGWWDIRHPYSNGRELAKIVTRFKERNPQGRVYLYLYNAFSAMPYLDGNPYANYRDGLRKPAYAFWSRSIAWGPNWDWPSWNALVARRPDMIVTSEFQPAMDPAGYRLAHRLEGEWFWRGHAQTPDVIRVYVRTGKPGSP